MCQLILVSRRPLSNYSRCSSQQLSALCCSTVIIAQSYWYGMFTLNYSKHLLLVSWISIDSSKFHESFKSKSNRISITIIGKIPSGNKRALVDSYNSALALNKANRWNWINHLISALKFRPNLYVTCTIMPVNMIHPRCTILL